MKFIHTADLHLGAGAKAKLPPEKARARRAELLATFRRIAALAADEGAAVLIAGDIFDSASPSGDTLAAFLNTVRLYGTVPFLCLPGNHDGGSFPACDIPENLHLFGEEWSCVTVGDTDVFGAAPRGEVDYDALVPDPARRNVVLLHGTALPSGKGEGVVSLARLADRGIDYLALGHFHSHRTGVLDERGVYAYSGTPEGRGMDEAGECGVLLVDTAASPPMVSFCRTAGRLVHIVSVDLSGLSGARAYAAAIRKALSELPQDDLVRVVLGGALAEDAPRPDPVALTEELTGGRYYLEILDKTQLALRPEDYAESLTLKGAFVRAVLDGVEDEELRRDILRAGFSALADEEDAI